MDKWAYILAPSYSGSTLLTFLLAAHPEVATIGELKASAMGDIERYDCSCGMRIRSCPFWENVRRQMDRRGASFDLANFGTQFRTEGHPLANRILTTRLRSPMFECMRGIATRVHPGVRRVVARALERNRMLSEVILDLQSGTVFLDGSKDPIRLKYMHDSGLWDIKVIYLVRDGRGATNSYMKHYGASMRVAALEWRRTHAAIERLRARLPEGSWVKIRYEDLCRDVDRTLGKVFAHLCVESDAASREWLAVENHILGNSMRLGSRSEIRLDEKWKAELSNTDIETFDRLAGDMNRKYGYD